ncbi:MAG: M20 family metallopeptidase [Candidatus Omnitrophota bacterium]
MINKNRLIKLTQDLIRLKSENPPGNEVAVAHFVSLYLKKLGLKPKVFCFAPGRDNVLAVVKGRSSSKPLLITPHLDTVPAGSGWSVSPFAAVRRGDKIYGRGASDCKGNLAVALEVIRSLREDKACLKHDLIFLATADEEACSKKGLIPILEKKIVKASYAVILDAADLTIVTAQKGLLHFTVKVFGRKAHGASPRLGRNAINGAVCLIQALAGIKLPGPRHNLLGPSTTNIGTIRGGDKVNMVADWCEFEVDIRFLPGMRAQDIVKRVKAVFNKEKVSYEISIDSVQAPFEISSGHFLVKALQKAARTCRVPARVAGSNGATVLSFFQDQHIPAVATGYGVAACMHTSDEFVRAGDLFRGAQVLERFIKDFQC